MNESENVVSPDDDQETLRKRAESRLQNLNSSSLEAKSPEQMRQIIHELQVYQVELEMQQEELRYAQREQEKSQANYRRLYQFAPNGYFTLNASGGLEECNLAAAQLLGAERRSLVGKLLRSFISVQQRPVFDAFFANLLSQNTTQRCEVELYELGKKLHFRTVVLEGVGLVQDYPHTSSYLITALDITERKQAELELQAANRRLEEEVRMRQRGEREMEEAKNLLQSVFDASVNGICLARSVRGYARQIIDFEYMLSNHSFGQLLGHTPEKTLFSQLFPLANIPGLLDKLKGVVVARERLDEEIEYEQAGEMHWFFLVALPLADGAVITLADMTQQKQAEIKLREVERSRHKQLVRATWEAQEEEKRRLSEALHNGLAQYLYAIRLRLDGIKLQAAPDALPESQASKAKAEQLILEAIAQTRNLSHELTPMVLEEFGLAGAIKESCRNMSGSNLWIHCQIDEISPALSGYLQTAIYRITQELVNNIFKHADATEASLTIRQQEDEISIQVIDNGKGFERQQIVKKGIGLHAIRNRVHLLEGIIDIQSQLGQGTEIRIWLPIA